MQTIDQCDSNHRENECVVVDMDGALLLEPDPIPFPYFALVAFDVGGIIRLFLLLMVFPLTWFLHHFVSQSASLRLLIFVTFVGAKVSDIESAANAVLPKYYSQDLHPQTWRVVSSCGKKCVVTMNPRIMVEPFLNKYLGVDLILGTEISSYMGIATGFVAGRHGVLVGNKKSAVVCETFEALSFAPNIAIAHPKTHPSFMKKCKQESYIVVVPIESNDSKEGGISSVKQEELPRPVIFHDGRLVQKPTPMATLLIIAWFPFGAVLSIMRILIGSLSSIPMFFYTIQLLGCRIKVKGSSPPCIRNNGRGNVFVCSHRHVTDPFLVATNIGSKRTACLSYSVSRLSEFLSPMKTYRLTRDRAKDAKLIQEILERGWNLVICPEGTTCREPYLLRFSALFAELTNHIVPVAVSVKVSMFHGTTTRGYKWLDLFFHFLNPFPTHEITFLDKLSHDQTCGGGKSSFQVANHLQKQIAMTLKFKCTNLTRKDKYQMLAGTDGLVGRKSPSTQ